MVAPGSHGWHWPSLTRTTALGGVSLPESPRDEVWDSPPILLPSLPEWAEGTLSTVHNPETEQ